MIPVHEHPWRARRHEPDIEIVLPLARVAAVTEDRQAIREAGERVA